MLWFRRLNLAAVALCFVVVVFGAYVRLSDAGLGCPDWPGCYGHLTVTAAAADSAKAWKEMIHRYLASTLGLCIVSLAILAHRLRYDGAPRVLPKILVALVVFQGMLGMWTVTWQLKPLAVCGHLLGGMTTLALLTWMWLSVRQAARAAAPDGARAFGSERRAMMQLQSGLALDKSARSPLRFLAAAALALLACQIFLGGWTSSNYAALACPDFPTCHGRFWPEMDAKAAFTLWRGLGINYAGGVLDNRARVTIHVAHRIGALAVFLTGIGLAWALWRGASPVRRRFAIALTAALILQVGIGIGIVKLQLPLALADMHNAGAAVLLLTLIALNHHLWTASRAD